MESGSDEPPSSWLDMELGKAVDLFLGEYKRSTRKAYSHALIPMQHYLGSGKPVSDILPEQVIEYGQKRIHNRPSGTPPYSAATKQKLVKTIKTFFNWCVRLKLTSESPAQELKARKPPRRISRDKAMTDSELDRLLQHLREKTIPRDFALVLFLADTGCRRGGAAGLKLGDIYWEKLTAVVTEKGDETRFVAFDELCAKALRYWLAYRTAHYRLKAKSLPESYVFSRDGLAIKAENLSLALRRACKSAGIRVLSPHSLRHRKGHQLFDARIAPSYIATILGHKDVLTTLENYAPDDWETAEQIARQYMTSSKSGDPTILPFPKVD